MPDTNDFKLTSEERHAVYAGSLKVLRRDDKPAQEAGATIIVGRTKGGRQILSRETGETIVVEPEPTIWITIKGWHLRAGSSDWQTLVTIHDEREQHRVLANGVGGIPREAGLRTRWGTRVVHRSGEVKVLPKAVLTKEQQKEHWTSETERGYGGRDQFEVSAEGDLVPATCVDDDTLHSFAVQAEPQNLRCQHEGRLAHRRGRLRKRLGEVRARGMDRAARAIEAELRDC